MLSDTLQFKIFLLISMAIWIAGNKHNIPIVNKTQSMQDSPVILSEIANYLNYTGAAIATFKYTSKIKSWMVPV
jgi:hypothetical protein